MGRWVELYALGMRYAHPVFLSMLLIALCASCDDAGNSNGDSSSSDAPGLVIVEISESSGIDLENVSGDPAAKMTIPENIGQGAACLDYDGDGDLDLFLANGDVLPGETPRADPRCALYRHDSPGKFTDVTKEAGLIFPAWCHGATAVDFEGDGDPDLYVTVGFGPNLFFENLGNGRFAEASAKWGGADPGPSSGAAFFDAEGDGDLDLYVGNYVIYDPENPPNEGRPCDWKELDVSCGPRGTTPGPDRFYENVDGKLEEATEKFGFHDVEPSYTLGIVATDFDQDGDVDLYIANDSEANYLFQNEGGRFKNVAWRVGVDMKGDGNPQAGMGLDSGDLNNDGLTDLFVTNFSDDSNTYYRHEKTANGKPLFTDQTTTCRLGGKEAFRWLSWGTRMLDLDLDGWQDLVVASGHVYPQVDTRDVGTTYRQPNQIFINNGPSDNGNLSFTYFRPEAESGWAKEAVSRGLVAFDMDDDGDHDFLVVEMDAKPSLFRNDTPHTFHWIGFHLVGKGKNRDAIGAWVELKDSNGVERERERCSGRSYLSSCDPRLLFGIGEASDPATAVVHWPDGTTTELSNLSVDRYHTVKQP